MTSRTLILIGTLASGLYAVPMSGFCGQDVPPVDAGRVWFKPELTVNADPVCSALLASVRKKFLSTDLDYGDLPGFTTVTMPSEGEEPTPGIEVIEGDIRQFTLTPPGGKRLYGYFLRHGGCGGACETEQLLVSDNKFTKEPDEEWPASTPRGGWMLVKDRKGAFYAKGIEEGTLQLFRIVPPSKWRKSCEVALKPDDSRLSAEPSVSGAFQAISRLETAAGKLARGAGNCGTTGTARRWSGYRAEALRATVYRPWAMLSMRGDDTSENSYGDYGRIEVSLKLWALYGLGEYRDFKLYEKDFAEAAAVLAKIYTKQLGWAVPRSLDIAKAVLGAAIAQGFGFYMYDPFPFPGERNLRRAILERRPIAEIRTLKVEKELVDLSVAIEYPEALQYLLQKGVNPDQANAFGKTPLMYAAQFNQPDAARLLLAAGADPNAGTIRPEDSCEYTVRTEQVTALHYAARYASLAFLKLLLAGGAVPLAASYSEGSKSAPEYPRDWLRRYTSTDGTSERNPNIASSEVDEAMGALRVPEGAERERIAADNVRKAEAEYAKGRVEAAYRSLRIAVAAQPGNPKAMTDLPLVALKAGRVGPAVEAAFQAVETVKVPALQAAAWFNLGLVCETKAARELSDYNGYRCDGDSIQPFLRAWQVEQTPARSRKLKGLFGDDKLQACTIAIPGAPNRKVLFAKGARTIRSEPIQRIYVLHRGDDRVDPASIQWSIEFANESKPRILTPNVVGKVPIDADTLTVLEGPDYGQLPTISGKRPVNPSCRGVISRAAPSDAGATHRSGLPAASAAVPGRPSGRRTDHAR